MTSSDIAKLWAVCGSGLAHLNRCAPRSEIWLTSYAVLAMSGEAYPDCNMAVIDVGGEPEATLTSFVRRLRERRLPGFFNFSSASAPRLGKLARDLELEDAGAIPLMIRRNTPLPSASTATEGETSIQRVLDQADLEAVAAVCSQAFDADVPAMKRMLDPRVLTLPGLDVFLARAGDIPVSALATTTHGGYVGIWAVATSPPYQRRGHGRAALTFALEYHRNSAEVFYLTASAAGRRLYQGLGFATADEGGAWVLTS
jgi:ribosomal protein S18 acetylase RimI-like enzyme